MKTISAVAALAIVGLVACDSPAALDDSAVTPPSFAVATTFTDNVSFPVNIGVFIPCAAGGAGEVVFLSGNLHSLSSSTTNDNNFTLTIQNHPQGISGVGLTTGDKYQGTGVTRETLSGSFVNGQFSKTFVNNFRIIGQGAGNNFLIHQDLHITFNANGELTASVDNFRAECK